jgi:hypothetical protein
VEYFDYSQPQTPCWDDTATPKRVAAISDPGVCVALLPARKTRMPETRTGPRAESYSTLLFNQASCWAQSDDNNPQSPSSQPLHFRGFSVVVDLSRHLSLRSWSLLFLTFYPEFPPSAASCHNVCCDKFIAILRTIMPARLNCPKRRLWPVEMSGFRRVCSLPSISTVVIELG